MVRHCLCSRCVVVGTGEGTLRGRGVVALVFPLMHEGERVWMHEFSSYDSYVCACVEIMPV